MSLTPTGRSHGNECVSHSRASPGPDIVGGTGNTAVVGWRVAP